MSWLARSLANSLKLSDEGEHDEANTGSIPSSSSSSSSSTLSQSSASSKSPSSSSTVTPSTHGVKEDLSQISKALTRQFWGMASFLAPPPESAANKASAQIDPRSSSELEESNEALIDGIRNDFAEIGGKVKSGISKLSNNKAVSEFTKIASNLLQFGSDRDFDGENMDDVGVKSDVVAFVRDISKHPETWLDFPVPSGLDFDKFDMSDVQQEHAMAMERVCPSLAALRIELCPGHMTESCFWKIYFILILPRLNLQSSQLLITPQIAEARAMVFLPELGRHEGAETEEHSRHVSEMQIVDKVVIDEAPPAHNDLHFQSAGCPLVEDDKFEDDGDEWLREGAGEAGHGRGTAMALGNDDDISFSDLEEDDDDGRQKVTSSSLDAMDHEIEKQQQQLCGPDQAGSPTCGRECSDWLDVDDIVDDDDDDVNASGM